MEEYIIKENIKLMCVRAESFPEGIMAAYQKLHVLLARANERKYLGISRPNENGEIIYKAAAEELEDGEAEKYGLESFIINKGTFISVLVTDFMKDATQIGQVFEKLLQQPNIDPQGYCLEMYINETDVRCMVGIKK
ncbi:transcriptional regulator [Pedobacter sp. GSP4]|uniref:transcriptional regulator n=1 Tax=Pedobacter sp. GSP4 TaxID=3453716 RepID=UPI003EF06691